MWLAGLQLHTRRCLKRQSVRTLASKYFNVVLGNWTASPWLSPRLGVYRAFLSAGLGIALFERDLKDDVRKRHRHRSRDGG